MRYLLGLFLILTAAAALRAQPAADPSRADLDEALRVRMALLARPGRDSIVLRWAPSKPGVWLIGNRTGYRLERATLDGDGRPGAFKPLVDTAIVPWPYERWLAYSDAHPVTEGEMVNYPAVSYALLNQFAEDGPAREDYAHDELMSIAERKQELEMRFTFAMYTADRSVAAAEGMGLRFTDRTVTPGASYIYRVYLAGSPGVYLLDTGSVIVMAAPPKDMLRTRIETDGGEGQILLRWKANRIYSSYFVDRAESAAGPYRRLNRVPLVTLRPAPPTDADEELFLDTTATGRGVYHYRVYGTTAFGDEALVGEGTGSTRDVSAPAKPFLPNPEHIAARSVRVRWEAGTPEAADLAGYHVSRGGTDSGPFTRLTARPLARTAREFIDTAFREDGSNYYLVEAVDTAGNISRSNSAYVALIDSTPPGTPLWIAGTMDSVGVVTLRLRGNRERDLMGYRLLRANAADHEFSVVIESFGDSARANPADTVYHDTVAVQTLTRNVYYRAVALDRNYNESAPSTILAVRRPDVVPPVAPAITDVFVTDTSVQIRYAPSSSDDAAYHAVYRRMQSASAWDSIARTGAADSVFTDRAAKRNITYEYAMLAVDSSGLRSERSMGVLARPYDPGTRPVPTGVEAAYDPSRRSVTLRWDYPRADEEYWFIVYRAGEDGMLRSFSRVSSAERSFVDAEPGAAGATVGYAVRAVAASGAQSAMSPKAQARIAP